ncbi:hypothetical protein ABMY26_06505 (plasmid) [Azospirillum sp. HJ39]|uniref:hypothetical protein n=1 Tax=Azospirillum sp. HJ39 TaxID=3159496 RepID=UPI003558D53A
MGAPQGWIGVDLDGTLARYDGWRGELHIGGPVPAMVDRVKAWLDEGADVRIFTARLTEGPQNRDGTLHDISAVREAIEQWCVAHIGRALPVTNVKDYGMVALYDDRAVQIIQNTGLRADGQP